jgi:predicted Rossmann fold nucleotide-binding protein DprA/Smf involved in DNA uptake
VSRAPDSELVALLLTQRLVEADPPPLKASEFWSLVDSVSDLAVLLGLGPADVSEAAKVDASMSARIVARLDQATSFAFALDDAQQSGLRILSALGDDFPPALRGKLGRSAPPLLYALGDVRLLSRGGLGVVGSRAVSETGAEVARLAATAAVAAGLGVLSGGAKGVDRLAMNAALDARGHIVGVLADSLLRTARDPEVRKAVSDGLVCLCSPYKPTAGFTVANAMGRNKLIYAMSTATLVVECEEGSGGTWAGAAEALRSKTTPVIAWMGPGATPGNHALVRLGARPLEHLDDLLPISPLEPRPAPAQLGFGF